LKSLLKRLNTFVLAYGLHASENVGISEGILTHEKCWLWIFFISPSQNHTFSPGFFSVIDRNVFKMTEKN